jgi:hypothetical protein
MPKVHAARSGPPCPQCDRYCDEHYCPVCGKYVCKHITPNFVEQDEDETSLPASAPSAYVHRPEEKTSR